jgi:hypothetical protein
MNEFVKRWKRGVDISGWLRAGVRERESDEFGVMDSSREAQLR